MAYYNTKMNIPNLPSTAVPLEGRNDAGKRVEINSVGGALRRVQGTVVSGPFTFTYNINSEDKKGRRKQTTVETVPYWQVLVDNYDCSLNFVAQELTFSR